MTNLRKFVAVALASTMLVGAVSVSMSTPADAHGWRGRGVYGWGGGWGRGWGYNRWGYGGWGGGGLAAGLLGGLAVGTLAGAATSPYGYYGYGGYPGYGYYGAAYPAYGYGGGCTCW